MQGDITREKLLIEPQHDMDSFPELRGELAVPPHVVTAREARAEARRIWGVRDISDPGGPDQWETDGGA